MPFAGSYIIGGKNYKKNKYLGTTTWDECADYLKKNEKEIFNGNDVASIRGVKCTNL